MSGLEQRFRDSQLKLPGYMGCLKRASAEQGGRELNLDPCELLENSGVERKIE